MDFDTKYSISFFTTLGLSLAGIISSGFLKGIPSFNLDFVSKNNKYAIGKAGEKVYLLNNETKELSLLKDNFNGDIEISPTDRYVGIGKLYDTDNNMEKVDLPLGRTPSLYLDERFVIIEDS